MKRILYLFIIIFSVSSIAYSQTKTKKVTFAPPFDFPLYLSGNFGELRTDHFHSGLDFKTGGVVGKKVRAMADGYISLIKVTHGSGYMLYVTYNNGYTTINRHLSNFVSPIAQRVERLQYRKERWQVTIKPRKGEYPVRKGQVIALGGNTGYSFGPHLHLDLIENKTGDRVDALPFFKNRIKDTTPPRVKDVRIDPVLHKGVVNGQFAWGKIGVAIKAFDYMDGTTNHYGVYSLRLEVDGQECFRSKVDRFNSRENKLIAKWAPDNYMKCYLPDNLSMRMLWADHYDGYIHIDEERDYHLQFILSDYYGNTTKYNYTLRGKKMELEPNWNAIALNTIHFSEISDRCLREIRDIIAPPEKESLQITPISPALWKRRNKIVLKSNKKLKIYRGTIDGKFVLFGMENAIRKELICRLKPSRVKRGRVHRLVFWAIDYDGNKKVIKRNFKW